MAKLSETENAFKLILKSIGENPSREGLKETPKRYNNFLKDFIYTGNKPNFNFTMFDAEGTDRMIVQQNIRYESLCEHHVLPFYGYAHIAYIPNKKIVGLSKLGRTVDFFSHRLQNQERLTGQIAEFLMEKLDAKGVGVILTGTHFCMSMRGVQKPDAITSTSKMLGVFETDENLRNEFRSQIKF